MSLQRPRTAALPSRGGLLAEHLKARLAPLHPAYFALAMATGIVAISCHLLGLVDLALVLSRINAVAYPTLWVLFIARALLFPEHVVADLRDHGRAPGYFTVVAATGVLGTQAVLLHGHILMAKVLWWATVGLWALCTYTVFVLLTVGDEKPTLADGINGGWLVAVVATQSICVLGATLNGALLGDRDLALFALLSFWLGGGMLYVWIIGLIFYRYMFFSFSPEHLLPPYWINMGAVAISTLAGALLARASESSPLLEPLRAFILGGVVMFWATATWWIPMLLALGVWRYFVRRVEFSYDPLYWGLVFPLGMYAACSFTLAGVLDVPFLLWIARTFVVVAVAVWLLTFLGLVDRLLHTAIIGLRRSRAADSARSKNLEDTGAHAQAHRRMLRGRRLVIAGSVLAGVGIIAYCVMLLSAPLDPTGGAVGSNAPRWSVGSALGVGGLGTLLWLVGSLLYLTGGMDRDLGEPDLRFRL